MQVVAGVERFLDTAGAIRVAPDGIEVQHSVEGAAGANPGVYDFARAIALLRKDFRTFVGRNCGGVDLHSPSLPVRAPGRSIGRSPR